MFSIKYQCHLLFVQYSSRLFFKFCIGREDDFLFGVSSTFSFVAKSITSADFLTVSGDKSNFSDSRFNCFSTYLLSRIEAILAFLFVGWLYDCFLFFTAFLIIVSIAAYVFTVS